MIEKHDKLFASNVAYVLAVRGEADRAFEWLHKAVEYRDADMSGAQMIPELVNLHDDPRWLPFLREIGRAPEQLAAIKFDVTLPE